MARRTLTVTIDTEGRDKGKVFKLTEMAADQAERWATRALLALTNAGALLPVATAEDMNMALFAAAGIQALGQLKFETAKPLLDEMMTCVQYQPPRPDLPLQQLFAGDMCQVEEVKTFFRLRMEVLTLHTGFSMPGKLPTSG